MKRALPNRTGRVLGSRRCNNLKSNNYERIRTFARHQREPRFFGLSSRRPLSTDSDNNESTHRLKLYNTMTETLEPIPVVESKNDGAASTPQLGLGWYTCGPTTYAPAHLGHARTYVCLDILRRVMTSQKQSESTPEPLFVLNITDVDDKTLQAALETNKDPLELARRFEREFWRDWDALNCLRPHIVTRVTEHVDSHIVPFVEELVNKGFAYELISGDGASDGVYFDVRAYNEHMGHMTRYGKLAPPAAAQDIDDILLNNKNGNSLEDCIDPNAPLKTKKDPRDFVLWKKQKVGEALSWSSPWGDGRPGWHIECSAMIEAVQKEYRETHLFKVHAGGIDLKFPHHTNEIAQSEAFLDTGEWIPHWVHTGHLHIDGLKMSKSLKNFVSIEEYLSGNVNIDGNDDNTNDSSNNALESPSDDFRLWCLGLSGSYRGPATFSMTRIHEARSVRYKFVKFLTEAEAWILENGEETSKWDNDEIDLFRTTDVAKRKGLEALENDLDGSKFVTELLNIVERGTNYMAQERRGPVEPLIYAIRQVRELLRLVGFTNTTTEAGIVSETSSNVSETALVDSLVKFRSTVRKIALEDPSAPGMKELLAVSDELRDSVLPEIGVQLMDKDDENGWKFCLPRKTTSAAKPTDAGGNVDLLSVPLTDYFKVGQHEGMFADYSEDGTPTHNADGSEVSKRLLKKLLKKREKHRLRLDKND